eukprot:356225-Chlamydomonas_euryale.AAC.15
MESHPSGGASSACMDRDAVISYVSMQLNTRASISAIPRRHRIFSSHLPAAAYSCPPEHQPNLANAC